MPGMDGLETAALIRERERSRDIPIILITADGTNDELITRGYALGAVDYIVKPIHAAILRSKVAVFVELFRKSAQVSQQATELAALNAELEARVTARTVELQHTVKELKQQMAEHRRAEAERARLLQREQAARHEAERAEQRAALLAEVSLLLDASFDYAATLDSLARRIVPEMGDLCMIDVTEDERRIQHVADSGADPVKQELWRELHRLYPPDPASERHPVIAVLRSGEPLVVPDVSDAWLQAIAGDAEHLRLLRELGLVSYVVMPVQTHGRIVGTMTWAMAESGRRYQGTDVALARELSRRIAQAVDNAFLYEKAREAVRLRDDFISMASHELRTPLTSIKASLQLVQRRLDRVTAQPDLPAADLASHLGSLPPLLTRALQQADVLNRLVDDLLDVSRIQGGQLSIECLPCDLVAILQ